MQLDQQRHRNAADRDRRAEPVSIPGSGGSVSLVEAELGAVSLDARKQAFQVQGRTCHNVEAQIPGLVRLGRDATPGEIEGVRLT